MDLSVRSAVPNQGMESPTNVPKWGVLTLVRVPSMNTDEFARLAAEMGVRLEISLSRDSIKLGRKSRLNDVVLRNPKISGNHVEFLKIGRKAFLKIYSRNRVFRNDITLPRGKEERVHNGDLIRLSADILYSLELFDDKIDSVQAATDGDSGDNEQKESPDETNNSRKRKAPTDETTSPASTEDHSNEASVSGSKKARVHSAEEQEEIQSNGVPSTIVSSELTNESSKSVSDQTESSVRKRQGGEIDAGPAKRSKTDDNPTDQIRPHEQESDTNVPAEASATVVTVEDGVSASAEAIVTVVTVETSTDVTDEPSTDVTNVTVEPIMNGTAEDSSDISAETSTTAIVEPVSNPTVEDINTEVVGEASVSVTGEVDTNDTTEIDTNTASEVTADTNTTGEAVTNGTAEALASDVVVEGICVAAEASSNISGDITEEKAIDKTVEPDVITIEGTSSEIAEHCANVTSELTTTVNEEHLANGVESTSSDKPDTRAPTQSNASAPEGNGPPPTNAPGNFPASGTNDQVRTNVSTLSPVKSESDQSISPHEPTDFRLNNKPRSQPSVSSVPQLSGISVPKIIPVVSLISDSEDDDPVQNLISSENQESQQNPESTDNPELETRLEWIPENDDIAGSDSESNDLRPNQGSDSIPADTNRAVDQGELQGGEDDSKQPESVVVDLSQSDSGSLEWFEGESESGTGAVSADNPKPALPVDRSAMSDVQPLVNGSAVEVLENSDSNLSFSSVEPSQNISDPTEPVSVADEPISAEEISNKSDNVDIQKQIESITEADQLVRQPSEPTVEATRTGRRDSFGAEMQSLREQVRKVTESFSAKIAYATRSFSSEIVYHLPPPDRQSSPMQPASTDRQSSSIQQASADTQSSPMQPASTDRQSSSIQPASTGTQLLSADKQPPLEESSPSTQPPTNTKPSPSPSDMDMSVSDDDESSEDEVVPNAVEVRPGSHIESPTEGPIGSPTEGPIGCPTEGPTEGPIGGPTEGPIGGPTEGPIGGPTEGLTEGPTEGIAARPAERTESNVAVLDGGLSQGLTDDPSRGLSEGQPQGSADDTSRGLADGALVSHPVAFTADEDLKLLEVFARFGVNWALVADVLNNDVFVGGRLRSEEQCRDRVEALQKEPPLPEAPPTMQTSSSPSGSSALLMALHNLKLPEPISAQPIEPQAISLESVIAMQSTPPGAGHLSDSPMHPPGVVPSMHNSPVPSQTKAVRHDRLPQNSRISTETRLPNEIDRASQTSTSGDQVDTSANAGVIHLKNMLNSRNQQFDNLKRELDRLNLKCKKQAEELLLFTDISGQTNIQNELDAKKIGLLTKKVKALEFKIAESSSNRLMNETRATQTPPVQIDGQQTAGPGILCDENEVERLKKDIKEQQKTIYYQFNKIEGLSTGRALQLRKRMEAENNKMFEEIKKLRLKLGITPVEYQPSDKMAFCRTARLIRENIIDATELKADNLELKDKNKKMQSEITELRESNAKLKKINDEKQSVAKKLMNNVLGQVDAIKKNCATKEREADLTVKRIEEEKKKLKVENEDRSKHCDQLLQKLKKLGEEKVELESTLASTKQSLKRCESQKDSLEKLHLKSTNENRELIKGIAQKNSKIVLLFTELQKIQSKLVKSEAELHKLSGNPKTSGDQKSSGDTSKPFGPERSSESSDSDAKESSKGGDVDHEEGEIEESGPSSSGSSCLSEESVEPKEVENPENQLQEDQAQAWVPWLTTEKKVAVLELQIDELRAQVDIEKQKVRAQSLKTDEVDDKYIDAVRRVDGLQTLYKNLENSKSEKEREYAEHQKQYAALQSSLEVARMEAIKNTAELESKVDEIKSLNLKLEEANELAKSQNEKETKESSESVAVLKKEISALKEKFFKSRSNAERMARDVQRLQKEKANVEGLRDNRQSMLKKMNKDLAAAKAESSSMIKQCVHANKMREEQKAKYDRSKNDIFKLNKCIDQHQSTIESQRLKLREQATASMRKNLKLREDVSRHEKDKEESKQKWETDLKCVKERCNSMEEQARELRESNKSLGEEMDSWRGKCAALGGKSTELERANVDLNTRFDALSMEYARLRDNGADDSSVLRAQMDLLRKDNDSLHRELTRTKNEGSETIQILRRDNRLLQVNIDQLKRHMGQPGGEQKKRPMALRKVRTTTYVPAATSSAVDSTPSQPPPKLETVSSAPEPVQPQAPPPENTGTVTHLSDSGYFGDLFKYQVHWDNPTWEPTWEPVVNLSNCRNLIDEFHQKYPDKPRP
eukprot:354265_1